MRKRWPVEVQRPGTRGAEPGAVYVCFNLKDTYTGWNVSEVAEEAIGTAPLASLLSARASRLVPRGWAVEVDPLDVSPGHVLGVLPVVREDEHAGIQLAEIAGMLEL